jgi:methylphosphotriester-DNA--protein-cysteine methyltransferase
MSHDRGCPCGKENGDSGYRMCERCKPVDKKKET